MHAILLEHMLWVRHVVAGADTATATVVLLKSCCCGRDSSVCEGTASLGQTDSTCPSLFE